MVADFCCQAQEPKLPKMSLSSPGGHTLASFSSRSRKLSHAHSSRSASSSASSMRSAINRADSTITALKCLERGRLADVEETESITSSYWDTDLEDNLSDGDSNEDGRKETSLEQEAYLKLCGKLGVIPVSRFGDQIGQEEVKVRYWLFAIYEDNLDVSNNILN